VDVQAARRVLKPNSDQLSPKKKAMFPVSLPRVLSLLLFFGLLFGLLTNLSVLRAAAPVPWERGSQNSFVTSLCADHNGHVFLGTEDQGLWRYDPAAPTGKQYAHFTTKDGLADDDVYALRKIIRQSFRKGLTNPKSCRILGSSYSHAESTVTFASPGMPFLCSPLRASRARIGHQEPSSMQAARTNAVKALHRFGPPTLIMLGSLWVLQAVFAHTGGHGVIIRNLSYDAGIVKVGSTVTDRVQLINLSSVPLGVGAQPGCGCTVASVPDKPLAPLRSEAVKLQVNTEGMKNGPQKREVLLQIRSGARMWQRVATVKFSVR